MVVWAVVVPLLLLLLLALLMLLTIDAALHVQIGERCVAVLRLHRAYRVPSLRLRLSRVRKYLDFIALGYRSVMMVALSIVSRGAGFVDVLRLSEHCGSLDHLTVTHDVGLIRHEATIMQLVLMVLSHRSLNVIRWKAAPAAVSIACDRIPVEVVVRLVLLGATDLVEDVCVDVRG